MSTKDNAQRPDKLRSSPRILMLPVAMEMLATCNGGFPRWLFEFLFSRIPKSIKHHQTSQNIIFTSPTPTEIPPNNNRSGFVCPSFSPMGANCPLGRAVGRASRFGRAAMSWASTRSSGPPRPMASRKGSPCLSWEKPWWSIVVMHGDYIIGMVIN